MTSRYVGLAGLCLSAALVWLTSTDISIALPTISAEMQSPLVTMQWLVTGFSLACTAVLAAGRLADVRGLRRIYVAGLITFAVASVLGALAPSSGFLIASRVAMGLGAAAILPCSLALTVVIFAGKQRAMAISVFLAVTWASQAIGPAVGGVFAGGGLWRWLFWLNVPLAAICVLLAFIALPKVAPANRGRSLDLPGMASFILGLASLIFGLNQAIAQGWGNLVADLAIAAGVALLAAFVAIERTRDDPVVDFQLFRIPGFVAGDLANIVSNAVFAGVLLLMAIYLQQALGYTPAMSGLLLLPATGAILVFNIFGTRATRATGARGPLILGTVIMTASVVVIGLTVSRDSYGLLLPGLLLLGLGIGLIITPMTTAALDSVGHEEIGSGSALFKSSSMLGGTLGSAFAVTISQAIFIAVRNGEELHDQLESPSQITGDAIATSTALTLLAMALVTAVAAVVIVRAASKIDRLTEPAF